MRALCVLSLSAFLPVVVFADISYTVTPGESDKKVTVSISFDTKGPETQLQMPNWAPGSYRLADNGARVKDLVCQGADGSAVVVDKPNAYTWSFKNGSNKRVTVSYSLDQTYNQSRIHLTGPATYLYVAGRLTEKCLLDFALPTGWSAYCGLDARPGQWSFTAPGYDVLADNPVSVGILETDSYTYRGVPHTIVYYAGDPAKVDRKKVVDACEFVTKAEADFFGGLPFKKYVWHFTLMDAPDGGWGLEHLTSTTMGIATGLGPGSKSVMAHEYFHAWNVKRIRSSVLGPFDYTQLPQTGALWWLEGVTDYYASLLTHRYGMFDENTFFGEIVKNVSRTRGTAARMEVSPYDASYRVREAANGRGNSQGYRVNYYNTGWLVGLCLDIELRTQTGGRRSLDDVMLALYDMCKNDRPGFAEDEIRKQLVRFGGPEMGVAYDKWVMSPGELPVEAQLQKMGMSMGTTKEPFADAGFSAFPSQGSLRVGQSSDGSELKSGDVITAINGTSLDGMTRGGLNAAWNKVTREGKPGDNVVLKYRRGDEERTAQVVLGQGERDVQRVWILGLKTPEQDRLRQGWLTAGKKKIPYTP